MQTYFMHVFVSLCDIATVNIAAKKQHKLKGYIPLPDSRNNLRFSALKP